MEVEVLCNPCIVCGIRSVVHVPSDGWALWRAGVLVQNAFPELDVDQRELLVNGTHAHCWVTLEVEE